MKLEKPSMNYKYDLDESLNYIKSRFEFAQF